MTEKTARTIAIGMSMFSGGVLTTQSLTHHSVLLGLFAGGMIGIALHLLYITWVEYRRANVLTAVRRDRTVDTIRGRKAMQAKLEIYAIKTRCRELQSRMRVEKTNTPAYRALKEQYAIEEAKLDDIEQRYFRP